MLKIQFDQYQNKNLVEAGLTLIEEQIHLILAIGQGLTPLVVVE